MVFVYIVLGEFRSTNLHQSLSAEKGWSFSGRMIVGLVLPVRHGSVGWSTGELVLYIDTWISED